MIPILGPILGAIGSAVGPMFSAANIGGTLSGIGGLLGGVAGMSAAKKAGDQNPYTNLLQQAAGARKASEEYGFNPLTMLQYGQTGAMSGGGGAAPLASIQMITDGLRDIGDVVSGDRARRQASDELTLDLKRIALDQARSGIIVGPMAATDFPGNPSPLGRRAVTVMQNGAVIEERNARAGTRLRTH